MGVSNFKGPRPCDRVQDARRDREINVFCGKSGFMRGRKPKPTKTKKRQGNPGKRKLPKGEPQPRAIGTAAPPAHLSADARLEWQRMLDELRQQQLLTVLDLGLLAAWCTAWGDYVEAERKIRDQGAVIAGRDGGMVRNPWVLIRNKSIEQMCRIGGEFGLTPASRPRLDRAVRPLGAAHDQPRAAGDARPGSLDAYLDSRPGAKAVH
jgi:P27 family predicted phage terminase small subunit